MPIFVLMTKLSSESMRDARDRKNLGKSWLSKVKTTCPQVRWIAHYALLGRYDFMDIYEAPDSRTAHLVSLISRLEGAESAESWQALPYEDYLKLHEQVQA